MCWGEKDCGALFGLSQGKYQFSFVQINANVSTDW
jgi:hypothetical protein